MAGLSRCAWLSVGLLVSLAAGVGARSAKGLFDDTHDDVLVLTGETFETYLRSSSSFNLVLFYSAYCGHCQHFAPSYIKLAHAVKDCRDKVVVTAINCVDTENREACNKHDIHGYPTNTVFAPHKKNKTDLHHYQSQTNLDVMISKLSKAVTFKIPVEQSVSQIPKYFEKADHSGNSLIVLADRNPNSNLAHELKLLTVPFAASADMVSVDAEDLTPTSLPGVPAAALDAKPPVLMVVNKPKEGSEQYEVTLVASGAEDTSASLITKLREALGEDSYIPGSGIQDLKGRMVQQEVKSLFHFNEVDREKVIADRNPSRVYMEDLLTSVVFGLGQEVTSFFPLHGERITALNKFLAVCHNYFPKLQYVRSGCKAMMEFVNEGTSQKEWMQAVHKNFQAVNLTYVNCLGTEDRFRGYPCTTWTLFHALYAQAHVTNSSDTAGVFNAMHAYIHSFFSCRECAANFMKETKGYEQHVGKSTKDSILYLWSIHNHVNKRLKGDKTEDPGAPKIQFPSSSSCPACGSSQSSSDVTDEDWDDDAVFGFMQRHYEDDNILFFYPTLEGNINVAEAKAALALQELRLDSSSGFFSRFDFTLLILVYALSLLCIGLAYYFFVRQRRRSPCAQWSHRSPSPKDNGHHRKLHYANYNFV